MFHINKEALDYIKRKGANVTIYMQMVHSGGRWCAKQVTNLVPAVRPGKPHPGEMKNYASYNVNGINIWKADNVKPQKFDTPISIGIKKRWIIYELTIDGVRPAVSILE